MFLSIDVNQTKKEFSAVEKKNDRLILSINNLRTQDPCISVISLSWRKLWIEDSRKTDMGEIVNEMCKEYIWN